MTYLLNEQGRFISQEHSRLAEMISEYSPDLHLVWIPLEQRALDETFPFAILHSPEGKEPYIVRKIRLQDMNEDLIAWCWMNDSTRNNRNLDSWLDAQEFAQKQLEAKILAERKAEKADLAVSILKGKNWYKHNGKVYS